MIFTVWESEHGCGMVRGKKPPLFHQDERITEDMKLVVTFKVRNYDAAMDMFQDWYWNQLIEEDM